MEEVPWNYVAEGSNGSRIESWVNAVDAEEALKKATTAVKNCQLTTVMEESWEVTSVKKAEKYGSQT